MPARLKKRADFRTAATGVRAVARAPGHVAKGSNPRTARGEPRRDDLFTLQAIRRADRKGPPRIGFTVTKKVGNAVVRNRIRRRLRAMAGNETDAFHCGTDYVVVARRNALAAPYHVLCRELGAAARAAHEKLQRLDATQPAGADTGTPDRTL